MSPFTTNKAFMLKEQRSKYKRILFKAIQQIKIQQRSFTLQQMTSNAFFIKESDDFREQRIITPAL